jgi:hypothetical protein
MDEQAGTFEQRYAVSQHELEDRNVLLELYHNKTCHNFILPMNVGNIKNQTDNHPQYQLTVINHPMGYCF